MGWRFPLYRYVLLFEKTKGQKDKILIKIVEYDEKYAKEMSKIIITNMYEINIKDYGKEVIDKILKHFTEEEIKKNFPNRMKCFVALDNETVVGTASINKYRGDETK